MSFNLQKPALLLPNRGLIGALDLTCLYVPNSAGDIKNLIGDSTLSNASASAAKFGGGPGGLGRQFTASANEEASATDVTGPRSAGARATYFGVFSVSALATNARIFSFEDQGGRYGLYCVVDSTNGLRTHTINSGYTADDYQSIGVAPTLDIPIAFVAVASGTSGGANLRQLYTSEGQFVTGTAGSNWYYSGLNRTPVKFGSSSGPTGHIYMLGGSDRIWSSEEIYWFLQDPYSLVRPPSIMRFGAAIAAGGGGGGGGLAPFMSKSVEGGGMQNLGGMRIR